MAHELSRSLIADVTPREFVAVLQPLLIPGVYTAMEELCVRRWSPRSFPGGLCVFRRSDRSRARCTRSPFEDLEEAPSSQTGLKLVGRPLRRRDFVLGGGVTLSSPQLALPGLHPELGPVTLGQLLATWVVHDLNHIAQVLRVMGKRYESAVGPWKPYFGILNR
jgi:hypothetical protein